MYCLMQGTYAASSVKAMVDNPQDRVAAVEKLIASAGGKFHHFFFTIGDGDWVTLFELPDDVALVALSMTVSASGAMSSIKTTRLLTADQATAAMTKAKSLTFSAPSS